MSKAYISFYLKSSKILIFKEALREVGNPRRICFMIDNTGRYLLMLPYSVRDLKSHAVPQVVYQEQRRDMRICSKKLCSMLAKLHDWDPQGSYRVYGTPNKEKNLIVLDLKKTEPILHE